MRNWGWILALLILLGLTVHVPIPTVSVEPIPPVVPTSGTFEKYGPRVDHLIFKVAGDPLREAYLVEEGRIDVMDMPVPRQKWDAWLADPKITMGEYEGSTIYFFALNNQMWPMGHGTITPEGWNSSEPAVVTGHQWINYTCQRCLDTREFRRALAHLTNKTLLPLFPGRPLQETFIPPILHEWENPNVTTYGYSQDLARNLLNAAGFNDYDGDDMLEYSPSHATPTPPNPPADMEELPKLQFYARVDDPDRKYAGQWLRDEMVAVGIPVEFFIADRIICYHHVWELRDYHIYTDAWTFDSRNPSDYYEIFYSKYDGLLDYIGYHSQEFDYWFEKLKSANTMNEAKEACNMCQEIVARDVASIPQYAPWGYVAHRTNYGIWTGEEKYAGKKWEGFVNELGVGFHSFWTHLNAHPQGYEKGGTLRQGLYFDIEKFSPVHAEWFSDWLVLDKIYEPLIKNNPYNVTEKIPWLCRNWTIGTWEFEGKNCTKITFDLEFKNGPSVHHILWHDNQLFTAEDVAFTLQYMKDSYSIPFYRYVEKLDHVEVVDEYTVTVYYQVQSSWALDWAGSIPIIPKHIWGYVPPSEIFLYDPEEHDTVIGTGPFRCRKDGVVGRVDRMPGEYIHLEANPTYFRKYIWPDVCDATHIACRTDGWVDLDDIMEIMKPGNIFTQENDDGTWPTPPGAWGEHCDVNKDGVIGIADAMEVCVHIAQPWPPPWYVDC